MNNSTHNTVTTNGGLNNLLRNGYNKSKHSSNELSKDHH